MLRKELLRENKVLVWENKLIVLREKSAKENVVFRENIVLLSAAS